MATTTAAAAAEEFFQGQSLTPTLTDYSLTLLTFAKKSPDPWVHGVSDNQLDSFMSLAPMAPIPPMPPIATYGT